MHSNQPDVGPRLRILIPALAQALTDIVRYVQVCVRQGRTKYAVLQQLRALDKLDYFCREDKLFMQSNFKLFKCQRSHPHSCRPFPPTGLCGQSSRRAKSRKSRRPPSGSHVLVGRHPSKAPAPCRGHVLLPVHSCECHNNRLVLL